LRIVGCPNQAGAQRPLHAGAIQSRAAEALLAVEREDEALAGHVQVARRAVDG
jgi:hypothetical protein